MALRRPPTTFSDSIDASDLAANSVTASELADNAVDAAAIAASAVTSTKIAANAISVKPHIQYGVLQPAVAGKDLSGTALGGSYVYGDAHTDGHKYYYTEITGSKPIKDPRIGAHFGCQSFRTTSLQLLEQETASHGRNVYSVDGREWVRAVGICNIKNDNHGNAINIDDDDSPEAFVEIVGYFNDANYSGYTTVNKMSKAKVNGGSLGSQIGHSSIDSPLGSRYVNNGSLFNTGITATLGINTLTLVPDSTEDLRIDRIELIAHGLFTDATCDTNHTSGLGSPASTSKITMDSTSKVVAGMSVTGTGIAAGTTVSSVDSATVLTLSAATTATNANQTFTFGVADLSIPAQNVVSYGKKFSISEQAKHYDPFNGFVNSTSLHSAFVDTATSLGLDHAPGSSAKWAISNSNNIRPYNGGRVVKWVASDGTIKTSVNMMPPNAQNILGTVAGTTEVTTPSATNTTSTPIFSDDAVDHSLSEVAKTYYWREFGNGAANGGTGHGSYADFSMHINNDSTQDDMSYVMDDGLTSLTGLGNHTTSVTNITSGGNAKGFHFTFIGTGITLKTTSAGAGTRTMALNLPYGTHIYKHFRDADATPDGTIDGVALADIAGNTYSAWEECTFHQPKKPPIPEDACIIADYMLMADHVNKTSHTAALTIAKGVRLLDSSRDVHHNCASGSMLLNNASIADGYPFRNYMNSGSGAKNSKIPTFATSFGIDQLAAVRNDTHVAGSAVAHTDRGTHTHINAAVTLGLNIFAAQAATNQDGGFFRFEIATPIHTSHHYQEFETPYLRELVGGDRNMEQNNLIVTPDGKSWDEVTRDTSYIGSSGGFNLSTELANGSGNTDTIIFTVYRGGIDGVTAIDEKYASYYNKDFAIAYNRMICLRSGTYMFSFGSHSTDSIKLVINGEIVQSIHGTSVGGGTAVVKIKRGDVVYRIGGYTANSDDEWSVWTCHRIGDN